MAGEERIPQNSIRLPHRTMPKIRFPKKHNEPPFFKDIRDDGYHIFSLEKAKEPNYYPKEIPDYPGVHLRDLAVDDVIIIRVFFGIGSGTNMRVDGGHIDLEIECIEENSVLANILTKLPTEFSLSKGSSIEVFEDEILYKSEPSDHYY